MKHMIAAIAVLTLAGCDAAEDSVRKSGSMLEQNYDATRKHMSKWIYRWEGNEEGAPPPKVLPNAYCYDVHMDILCYEEPQPHLGTKLVAYQGTYAYPPHESEPVPSAYGMSSAPPPYGPHLYGPDAVVSKDIIVYDVPPPFEPASPETMARVEASGQSGSSVTVYTAPNTGAPRSLME